MTTTRDLIQQTHNYLLSSRRGNQNVLAASYTAGDTNIAFEYEIKGLQPGAYLAIDLEVFQVFDVNVGGKSVTVIGGTSGSTAANHTSGTICFINPEFTDYSIFRELNNDLDDLSSPTQGLFQVKTVEFTYNNAVQGYNLDSDVDRILEVKSQDFGIARLWPIIPPGKYALKREQDTSVFASGVSLTLYEGGNSGYPVRVTYAAAFNHLATITDDVTTVTGLSSYADDLPTLGAALRLVGIQEIKRNLTGAQGDTRRSSEVPAGAILRAAAWIQTERRRRITSESARLERDWIHRRRGR